jgi:hypothetical protein
MNITLVPEDGTVIIDGNVLVEVDKQYLSWVPENVHAMHWYGDYNQGEIEFKYHPLETKPPNQKITELGIYSQVITVFEEELQRRSQKELDEQELIESQINYYDQFILIRDQKLLDSDWTQLNDSPLTEEKKEEWRVYRQELRDLPDIIEDPKPLVDDPNHPSWPIPPE